VQFNTFSHSLGTQLTLILRQKLVLHSGEQIMAMSHGSVVRDAGPSLERAMAWPERRLFFKDEPLVDLITEFNRYHDVSLRVADPEVAVLRVSGTFDAYDRASLIEFLRRFEGVDVVTAPDGTQTLTRLDVRK
jgi:transmembrane sensor